MTWKSLLDLVKQEPEQPKPGSPQAIRVEHDTSGERRRERRQRARQQRKAKRL